MDDPMLEQVDVPKGDCDSIGSLQWSKLLTGPVEREDHAGAGVLAGRVTHVV